MKAFDVNLRHLRAFVKIYELGTLLKAAKAVNITQPALTQGLTRLEDCLNTRLFQRQSDGMHPTEAATTFYPRAKAALGHVRSNRVTMSQLRAFLALAKRGSYAGASTAIGNAKASIHRAVSDLEVALNQTLVQRRGRSIELTSSGASIARRYNLAVAELEAALSEVKSLRGDAAGRVSIGAMPLCRARILPAAIVTFQSKYPTSDVFVAEGSHDDLIDPLRNGELDFIVGALRAVTAGPDLVQIPLFEDQPVIVARQTHPIHSFEAPVKLDDLTRYNWCIPPRGVPLRDRWTAMFESEGKTPPPVRIECGSVIAIRQILMNTDCLSILSRDQIMAELQAGWLKVVCDAPKSMHRVIGYTHRHGWRPTKVQSDFVSIMEVTK